MFRSASESAFTEIEARRGAMERLLHYGVDYLDDVYIGISPCELSLIGAPTGIGKTQLCCSIAQANLNQGKRVHYIALEAEQYEIERRIKYQMLSQVYFADPRRPRLDRQLSYDRWRLGAYLDELREYEKLAADYFEKGYRDLHIYYKQGNFAVEDLIEQVVVNSDKTDLIIVDHVHYFDFDDQNENRALKKIATVARDLTTRENKPMILVAHLRKRDKFNEALAADVDEFHGSSDLTKIATQVITISPGQPLSNGTFETFFRTGKNRNNGGSSRYLGRATYSLKKGVYEPGYKIGWASQKRKEGFAELDHNLYPDWARRATRTGSSDHPVSQKP